MRLQRRATLTALVLALPAAVFAGPQGLRVVKQDSSGFPALSATFELRLPSGELSDSIPKGAAQVLENGVVVDGAVAPAGSADGVAYLFSVDTSGTMKPVLPAVREAITAFVDKLGPKDRAGILTFDDDARLVHPLTADKSALKDNLGKLATGGASTQLYLAIVRAAEALQAPGLPPRRVVIVISDGKDEGTAYTLDDAIGTVTKAQACVAALGITGGDARHLLNLQRMAEKTDGLYLRIEPGANWLDKTALVRRHVDSRFTFSWTSHLPTDGKNHTVRLQVSEGGTTHTTEVAVTTPLIVVAVPIWKRLEVQLGGGAAVVLVGVVVFLLLRSRKKHSVRVAELRGALESEKRQRAAVEEKIGQGLEDVKGKLQELEKPAPAPAPPPPSTPTPAAKRKTMFVSGSAPAPDTYRSALLEVQNGPLAGSRLPIPEGRTTLGRDETNRIVVMDEKASSQHAVLTFQGGSCVLEDVGSTNGTYVDEQRLSGPWTLSDGERVRVGSTLFLFRGERT